MSWSYAKAGLDLLKHRSMHSYVIELMKSLAQELGVEVKGLGGYGTSIRIGDLELMIHVDGVGTKTLVLEKLGRLAVAGWDCVAMNVNDVVCDGGKPMALVDYVAMPRDDPQLFKIIIEGLIDAAKIARVPVLGGETAILRDLVNGIDVVCTVVAIKKNVFINKAKAGDIAIGVESWGLHANGYTLVRKVIDNSIGSYDTAIDGVDLGIELSKPTAVYSNIVLEAIEKGIIHSVAHITGGAFTKVKRILDQVDIVLEMPRPPPIFEIIMKLGNIDIVEMYKVFNMGIGLVITTSPEYVDQVMSIIKKHGFKANIIGKVVKGENRIQLKLFDNTTIIF